MFVNGGLDNNLSVYANYFYLLSRQTSASVIFKYEKFKYVV